MVAIVTKCKEIINLAQNINLATTIGEKKIAGENFCLALERHLENVTSRLKSLTRVVHV